MNISNTDWDKYPIIYWYLVWIGDNNKYIVHNHIPVDTTNKYIDSFRRLDKYIGTQIIFSTKTGPELIKVTSRKRDGTGHLIGTKHSRPTLDSQIYSK